MPGTTITPLPPPRAHTERTIGLARVVLASASLFAVWMDPTEPAQHVGTTYALYVAYVIYSLGLSAFMWNRSSAGRVPVATHLVDIVLFSIFQYLTLGPSSPYY